MAGMDETLAHLERFEAELYSFHDELRLAYRRAAEAFQTVRHIWNDAAFQRFDQAQAVQLEMLEGYLRRDAPAFEEFLALRIMSLRRYLGQQSASSLSGRHEQRDVTFNAVRRLTEPVDPDADANDVVHDARAIGLSQYDGIIASLEQDGPDENYRQLSDGSIYVAAYDLQIARSGDVTGPYARVKDFLAVIGLSGERGDEQTPATDETKKSSGITVKKTTAEAHHLIPTEQLVAAGLDKLTAPSVAVLNDTHMTELHGQVGLTSHAVFDSFAAMEDYYETAYAGFGAPEWGRIATAYLRQHREQFTRLITASRRKLRG